MRGPAVDVGFSSEWALLLRSSAAPPPSPIDNIKTPITPFGDYIPALNSIYRSQCDA
jgi:hypothetical protein